MTLLVRDEADVIDRFVRYHSRAGIDALIVTDNGSRDGTREILEQHRREGAVTEIIDEPSRVFNQPGFVDRMIRRARDYYAADYCINSDADEFWYLPGGSFRSELSNSYSNKVYCASFYMLPVVGQDFWRATDRCAKRADPRKFGITDYYNLFNKPMHKVIHRTEGYKMIEPGNHGLEMDGDFPLPCASLKRLRSSWRYRYSTITDRIWIYHYSLRTLEQFTRKVVQNGMAIEANKNSEEREASHWRYLYRGYKANTLNLEAEFYKLIGRDKIEQLRKEGIVISDDTMRQLLATS